MSFQFDRTVTGVAFTDPFEVNGESPLSLVGGVGTDTLTFIYPSFHGPGEPYDVNSFAGLTFSPAGVPDYPLDGTTV